MLNQDFKEFVELLNKHKAEYLIVGGYALGIHGYPRYTGDLDVWINPTPENAQKIIDILHEFGFSSIGLTINDFIESGNVIQLGYPPFRIDILTKPDGITFDSCDQNKLIINYDGIDIAIIGIEDFKKNKKATGRIKDLDDLNHLK